jgi:predicted methyltransferase
MTLPNKLARLTIGVAAVATLTAGLYVGGAAAQDQLPDYAAIVAASDRTDADRQTDSRRDPLKLLIFTRAQPGMKVLDMGAGGGYSTELMARAVAPGGVVYGQNPADLPERAKARFEARLQTPAGKNIVSLARPFDDPLPADLRDLDVITPLLLPRYHLHERRSRRDGPQALCRAKAGWDAGDCGPFCATRRWHHSRQDLASHRGECAAPRD